MKKINIKGTIIPNDDKWIYDYFEYDSTCPKDIEKCLNEANGDEVTLIVNSGGGDVFAGNEIGYLLNQYKGRTTADIVGIAASIATVICCGVEKVRAVPGAQYMIHNVVSSADGDFNVMDKASEILKNANKTIANTYRLKTGMSEKELLELMNKETWLDAVKAKEYGFIDEIIGDNNGELTSKNALYNSMFANIISEEVKAKVRNSVNNPDRDISISDESDFLMQKEQLTILRMRGEIL